MAKSQYMDKCQKLVSSIIRLILGYFLIVQQKIGKNSSGVV